MTIIDRAREFAKTRHEGQFRRDGKPYFTHLEAVAKITEDLLKKHDPYKYCDLDTVIAISFLHDILESDKATFKEVESEFNTVIANGVHNLTRQNGETYFHYIIYMTGAYWPVRLVKIADLTHNLNDGLGEGSMKDKYRFAKYILEKSL